MATATQVTRTFKLGGELEVQRLGYGAMRITGKGVWGEPPDREAAKKVLQRAVELGVGLYRHRRQLRPGGERAVDR